MSEHMAAEIWIGGTIARTLVPHLCTAITQSHVSNAWGDRRFAPHTAADLLSAIQVVNDVQLLWLCHDAAGWGEFPGLEEFLQEHEIPFTRRSAGKYEFDPEVVDCRPGQKLLCRTTNAAGQSVVAVSELSAVRRSLQRFRTNWLKLQPQKAARALEQALEQLEGDGAELLPLAPFVIADR
jgi:hypothetical protein